MSIYTHKQRNIIVLVITILLGLFIAWGLMDIFTSILGAIIIYTIFRPFYTMLVERRKVYKWVSAFIVMISSFILIVLPFIVLSWLIIDKIIYFNDNPEEITEIINTINQLLIDVSGAQIQLPDIAPRILENIESWVLGTFTSVINVSLRIFLLISVLYFMLYFMLVNYKDLESTIPKYLPFSEENKNKFATELKNITFSNVVGQGVIALIQATLLIVGFFVFGIADPWFWGVIAFFLSFIPFIGTPFVFVPAGLVALSSGNSFGGIGIILFGFIFVTNIDNLLRFMINRRMANTHPVVTILGVIIGIPFFGILGLVVGPLLISYFILLVKIFEAEYAKARQQEDLNPDQ